MQESKLQAQQQILSLVAVGKVGDAASLAVLRTGIGVVFLLFARGYFIANDDASPRLAETDVVQGVRDGHGARWHLALMLCDQFLTSRARWAKMRKYSAEAIRVKHMTAYM